ncbi:MAG: GerAB/ArcD/ProY family transporter, partial [Tumebacillaceae bacterium]
HPVYFLPLSDVSISSLMSGTYKASLAALGFELLLIIYPFVQKKKKVLLASSIGIWLTVLLYLIVTVIAIGFMSTGQLKHMLTPTLYMFHFVELPILERVEQLVIAGWSFLVVNVAAAYVWSAGRYVVSISKWKETSCTLLFVPLLAAVGALPKDTYAVSLYSTNISNIGGILAVGIAPLLLLCAVVLKKRGAGEQQKKDA